jgi:rhomboid protease GluP
VFEPVKGPGTPDRGNCLRAAQVFGRAATSCAQLLRSSPLAWLLASAIILAWLLSAIAADQSIFAVQESRWLLELRAIDGALLRTQWWRLVSSQFLHVHFPHMLFNALCIFIVGRCIETRRNWWILGIVYLVGGTIGQVAGVLWYPDLASSGASQALMALCGAALLMRLRRWECLVVAAILVVQLALDLHAVGTIKTGHGFGFLGGLVVGALMLYCTGSGLKSAHRH